jgi:hypothetical protein
MISICLNEAAEVRQNAQAKLLTFLRMKLASEQSVGSDAGNEGLTIVRRGRDQRALLRHNIK